MTLKDVHERIPEISISRLSNWEQGINMVSVDEAKKLASVLKVPAAYLLTLDDAPMDDTERLLLEKFRLADVRGRRYILRAAQDETHEPATEKVVERTIDVPKDRRKAQTIYFGPDRRGQKEDEWPKK